MRLHPINSKNMNYFKKYKKILSKNKLDKDIENSKYLTNHFNEMWHSIPNKWLNSDTQAESKDSINSCYDGIDNDFDEMTDGNDSKCI